EPFDIRGTLAAAEVHVAALAALAGRIEPFDPPAEAVEVPARGGRRAHVREQALATGLEDQRALELPAAIEEIAVLEADLPAGARLAAVADAEDGAPGAVLVQVDREGHGRQFGVGLEHIEFGHHAHAREISAVAQPRLEGEQLLERIGLARA